MQIADCKVQSRKGGYRSLTIHPCVNGFIVRDHAYSADPLNMSPSLGTHVFRTVEELSAALPQLMAALPQLTTEGR